MIWYIIVMKGKGGSYVYRRQRYGSYIPEKIMAWRDGCLSKCKNGNLIHLHKKAKKSNNDWKCPQCGEIYRTITMLQELPND